MRTIQAVVLECIENTVAGQGGAAFVAARFPNTGAIYVKNAMSGKSLFRIGYEFDPAFCEIRLVGDVFKEKVPPDPDPTTKRRVWRFDKNEAVFGYLKYDEDERFAALYTLIAQGVREA